MSEFYQYFANLGPLQLVGIAGFGFYIMAFGLVQLGRLDGNSTQYSVYNVLAASLVATSLIAEFNLASALIQASWICIGLVGISRRLFRKSLAPVYPAPPVARRDF